MSFYGSLDLVANTGLREISRDAILSILGRLELLAPVRAGEEFGNLNEDIQKLFDDVDARAQNDRFFQPDSLAIHDEVELADFRGHYRGPGWRVSIHGNGYHFPWEPNDFLKIVSHPKLRDLRLILQEQFGGRFLFTPDNEEFLHSLYVGGEPGWIWLASSG